MKIQLILVLSALVATTGLVHVPKAAAGEIKPISTATCQRYFKGPVVEMASLEFLAEGVRNVSSSYQYVICPLPKSAKKWDAYFNRKIGFYFHRDAPSAPPVGTVLCSLNAGSSMSGNGVSTKILAAKPYGDYAEVLFDETTGPNAGTWDTATAICGIPPKYTLEYITFEEG